MFLVVSRHLVPRGFGGLAIFPFIFLASMRLKGDSPFINHERIHLRQQAEMLIVPFFLWYGLEFLVRLIAERNFSRAYHNISFEREAYAMEKDPLYLKNRPFWNFLHHI